MLDGSVSWGWTEHSDFAHTPPVTEIVVSIGCGPVTLRARSQSHYVQGQPRRRKKRATIRGLNKNYNLDLKGLFKGAATGASVTPGPFQEFYQRSLAKGIKPTMVRLTLARKIAAITLILWKKGEDFDLNKLNSQAA